MPLYFRDSFQAEEFNGMGRFSPKQAALSIYERNKLRNLMYLQLQFSELDEYAIKQVSN